MLMTEGVDGCAVSTPVSIPKAKIDIKKTQALARRIYIMWKTTHKLMISEIKILMGWA
jgi:hypothetical protein